MNLLKQIGLRAVKKMSDYPKDWEEVTINLVSPIRGGYAFKSNMYARKGVPIVRISNILSNETIGGEFEHYKNLLNDNDFKLFNDSALIAMSGATTGKVALLKAKSNTYYYQNQRVGYFKKTGNINYYFLSYVVRGESFKSYLNSILTTGAQPNISPKQINMFSFSMPSLQEQKAIADTLTIFDKHIEKLEKLIEKKKMIRDGALEDLMSGKRRLEGFNGEWEEVSFNDVITPKARIGWQGLKKDEYLESGYSYLISGTDFENGTISFDNINYVTKERFDLDINIQVTSGDVLVTKDGTIGKVAIVPIINKKATLNSGVFVFKTNDKLKSIFLFMILRSSIFKRFIDELSAGSTIKHLYQKDLKTFSFYIPIDIKKQEAIATILTSMDDEIEDLEKEKAKIENLKAGAMDDLLTGRVRLI